MEDRESDHESAQAMEKPLTFDGESVNSGQMQNTSSSGQTTQIHLPNSVPKAVPTGWVCPLCSHGVAPDVKRCPCQDQIIPSAPSSPIFIPYPWWTIPWYTVEIKSE